MIRRPSEYRPEGLPKKVSPLGGGTRPKAAEAAPVSELESPKLNTAGKRQVLDDELRNEANRTMAIPTANRLFFFRFCGNILLF